jgi:o-succinylbenzoate synthase
VNGLVWMNDAATMRADALGKARSGYRCIKLKIGGVALRDELSIIRDVRSEFGPDELEIRTDANGAFEPVQALRVLEALADLKVHSIEQPIPAGMWTDMADLCRHGALPVALDEELIGVDHPDERARLLDTVKPAYLILKPTLLGGFASSDRWIALAAERGIGWWATSALESNIGLNAIAQWVSRYKPVIAQGLGTGMLFRRNSYPLWEVREGWLHFRDTAVPSDWTTLQEPEQG